MESSAPESLKSSWIGLVLIGSDRHLTAFRYDPTDKFLDAGPGGLRSRSAMSGFEKFSLCPLRRPHRATATKFSLSYAVDEVRGTDQQVQVEGPVLAVFEGSKAVEYQGLAGSPLRTKLFMEKQAVTAQTFGLVL
jgi:hypothetical protein